MDDSKRSILIVDDDESICKSLSLIFDKKGYDTVTASTGQEALAKAQERFFNVALLDIRLPDIEGIELLSPLQKLHPEMILLVVTGYASLKTAMHALNNGASGYLTKPVDVDELLGKIKDNLEMQRLRLENAQLNEALQEELAERKRAEAEVRRRNRELVLLNQIISASATHQEIAVVLDTACSELAHAFDVSYTVAAMFDEKKMFNSVVAEYRSENQPSLLNVNVPVKDDPLAQHLLENKSPLAVSDVKEEPRLVAIEEYLQKTGVMSLLVVPLTIKQELVGSLTLGAGEPREFSSDEINLAWSVAEQISGVLARIRLTQAHQRLFTAIEQTADSVVITDLVGNILYVNPAFEQVTGYRRSEALGQNPRILKSGQQETAVYAELWDTITTGKVWQGRFINKKKDGSLFTEEVTISPIRDENDSITNFVAVKRDVTHELALEQQYHQAQKMEMVGQLTGGIAHDFNNLLTAVIGFAELIQLRSSDEATLKLVDKILYSGRRASDLVGQLMAFSRKQIIELEVLNLNDVVANIQKMLRRVIGEDTGMETILASDLWPIRADHAQIEQVIVNLAVNARDAMPNGGKLTIETANVVLDKAYAADHLGVKPGDHVMLAVSDTGIGMSKEIQARVFEPFFTTKPEGKGSGLGLATVFGIVQQSDGHIWLYSEEGVGSTFKIYFPKSQEAIPAITPGDQIDEIPRGSETILLVEDESAVRDMAAFTLQEQGYVVLEAGNGQEALRRVNEYDDEIHLLLTDVVMPEMNGKDLADQIQLIRPGIKTLFTSGYTDDAIVQHGVLKPGIAFLPKPFSPSALGRKVRETLDSSQKPSPTPPSSREEGHNLAVKGNQVK